MCFRKSFNLWTSDILVFLAILQSFITCPGCSVKENRDICPCILEVNFTDTASIVREKGIRIDLSGYSGKADGYKFADTTKSLLWRGPVPRGDMILAAVYDEGGIDYNPESRQITFRDEENWIKIEKGKDCPRIWLNCLPVSTCCDQLTIPMTLRKSYCKLTVLIRDESDASFPFRLEVRGNICGYGTDGSPAEGDFIAPLELKGDESMYHSDSRIIGNNYIGGSVCLPRQKNDDLMLDIISERESKRTFAIGNYIADSGYSWDKEDLEDIILEIDFARTGITFSIGAWKHTESFEVVI